MTGYAKIGGTTMPVWKAFTLTLVRFFNVQVWSWIPERADRRAVRVRA
jgi:putative peptide zinc metalloprotease protein